MAKNGQNGSVGQILKRLSFNASDVLFSGTHLGPLFYVLIKGFFFFMTIPLVLGP